MRRNCICWSYQGVLAVCLSGRQCITSLVLGKTFRIRDIDLVVYTNTKYYGKVIVKCYKETINIFEWMHTLFTSNKDTHKVETLKDHFKIVFQIILKSIMSNASSGKITSKNYCCILGCTYMKTFRFILVDTSTEL